MTNTGFEVRKLPEVKIWRNTIISEDKNENQIRVFEFNDQLGKFQELDMDEDLPLYDLLDSESILSFIDPKHKRLWIWIGSFSSTKMRFMSTQASYLIRDRYVFGFKISTVDEGDEHIDFKVMLGLEEEMGEKIDQIRPLYRGTPEEDENFESLSEGKILLIMKKIPIPKGYQRKLIIVNNVIYLYKESTTSLGSDIKKERLFRLKEEVSDGIYQLDGYTPRILFSFNKILLIDLMQKNVNQI